ncbi:MAG TPA: RluA family pseudouridine synthase [Thermoanaerobaculia bacterium]|nr:RluA family pseudouridine synthase [Thermoanaerobaculia bacterium]
MEAAPGPIALEVTAGDAGERLDRWLAGRLGVPRNQVQGWIRAGSVLVNARSARPSQTLSAGDRVTGELPAPAADPRVTPESGELVVLYEDDWLVALDKPAGIAVHPGAGRATGTLVHRLLARYPEMAGVGGPGRPGIVHRLDLGTSGVLVLARRAEAYHRLVADFAARRVAKQYLAIVYGSPREPRGRIEAAIGRHPTRRKEMTQRPDGRPATTGYQLVASARGTSLLVVDLFTGRTHQIRVHLKALGHPLVGDPVYGEARWKGAERVAQGVLRDFTRPALHAWRLRLAHPQDGRPLELVAPPPPDLAALWARLSGGEMDSALAGLAWT